MSRVFHVISGEDGRAWTSFLKEKITKNRQSKFEFRSTIVTDLFLRSTSSKRLSIDESDIILIILTPGHIAFLNSCPQFDYHGLIRSGQKGVLFFCGTDEGQLEGSGDLCSRFPWYGSWEKLEHTNSDELMNIVDELVPFPSLSYQMIPSSIRCESGSMVALAFSDTIANHSSDLQIALYVAKDEGAKEEEELQVSWVNDKTVRFNAPERTEGKVRVRVLNAGNPVMGTEFLHYRSSCELISDMMQLYIHSMHRLFLMILSKSLLSAEELDNLLFSVFNDEELKGIQPQAFEELFGIFRYKPTFKSQVELPTLLHLANKFGLKRFESWLHSLPDAGLATRIQNSEGLPSEEVHTSGTGVGHPQTAIIKPSQQMGPSASDHLSTPSDSDEECYLIMDKQPKQNEKPNVYKKSDDDDDEADDDDDYLVMDKSEKQPKKSEQPIIKNEDEDFYFVMDKQLKQNEDENIDEDIYDLYNGEDAVEEEEEANAYDIAAGPSTAATNLKNKIIEEEQLPATLMQHGQRRLIELMNQFKAGELTMDEVNILFSEWKINNPQKQFRIADRQSTLQSIASELSNHPRRKENEIPPTISRVFNARKDSDPAPLPAFAVLESSTQLLHRASVTLDRHLLTTLNNRVGNHGTRSTHNMHGTDSGTDDTVDDDGVRQACTLPNNNNRINSNDCAPPLPARKQGSRPANKCATLPKLPPSRVRKN